MVKLQFSLVVPLFNEAANIKFLLDAVRKALHDGSFELILVDDGSTDSTVFEVRKYLDKYTKLLCLQRNYGQSIALAAGIAEAKAKYIVTLDGDLQNDPEDILAMLDTLHAKRVDVVCGTRVNRQDRLFRMLPSWCANRLIAYLSGVHISDYGCTLKLFKQSVAKQLALFGELHRFIPILCAINGAKITQMPVKHHKRMREHSKYEQGFMLGVITRMLSVISDLTLLMFLKKYSLKPMHLFARVGLVAIFLATILLLLGMMVSVSWMHSLLLPVMLFMFGLQFVLFGLMREMLMRTYFSCGQEKPYVIIATYKYGD